MNNTLSPNYLLRILSISCLSFLLLCACGRPEVDERFAVKGLDVSRYQGAVDWDLVAEGGQHFAFIKASEGREHRDIAFQANWTGAGRAGLRRGAYHYFLAHVSVEEQLSNYIDLVKLAPGDLPPVLDVEHIGNLSSPELVSHVKDWLHLAEAHYGIKPILYTGLNFYNRFLAGQFDDYPLWLARYDNRDPVTICGRPYQFWQFTDQARINGIVGNVDRNVFSGTLQELEAICVPYPHDEQQTATAK
ncbi:lysozyme [Neolewinella xylanilytica]|uniref:Lysozyme n=1 Tax=Neolewinella xylanilytica TaxID=1514080 RepID=A0A2S6I6T7_9BACT|nr:GH25 family lysozyme [Neolewinella xylanilytica]PPK87226.1 lysozyme [Neolewinella xylanilytica]